MFFLRFSKRVGDGDPAAVGIVAVFRAGQVAYSQSGVFGRRVSRTVGSTTIRYIYDGQQVFAELDGSENIDAVYTYYPGIDRPHMMERSGSRYYYGFDVPGNILGLFDGSGLVNKYVHTAFGQADTTSHSVTNPYRYMSRRYDDESGLYFMRARYYDPDIARFVSEDPIGLMGGINTYAFAGNDPANRRDPLGLCEETGDDHDCYYLDGLTVTVGKRDSWWRDIELEWAAMNMIRGTMFSFMTFEIGGGGGGGGTTLMKELEYAVVRNDTCLAMGAATAAAMAGDGLLLAGGYAVAGLGLKAAGGSAAGTLWRAAIVDRILPTSAAATAIASSNAAVRAVPGRVGRAAYLRSAGSVGGVAASNANGADDGWAKVGENFFTFNSPETLAATIEAC